MKPEQLLYFGDGLLQQKETYKIIPEKDAPGYHLLHIKQEQNSSFPTLTYRPHLTPEMVSAWQGQSIATREAPKSHGV